MQKRSISRGRSALAQSNTPTSPNIDKFVLNEAAEVTLAKRLCQFAEIVPQVLNDFRPNILANYLFELANSFHAFYEACPVLKSEESVRNSRLALSERAAAARAGLHLPSAVQPQFHFCRCAWNHTLSARTRGQRRLRLSLFPGA